MTVPPPSPTVHDGAANLHWSVTALSWDVLDFFSVWAQGDLLLIPLQEWQPQEVNPRTVMSKFPADGEACLQEDKAPRPGATAGKQRPWVMSASPDDCV